MDGSCAAYRVEWSVLHWYYSHITCRHRLHGGIPTLGNESSIRQHPSISGPFNRAAVLDNPEGRTAALTGAPEKVDEGYSRGSQASFDMICFAVSLFRNMRTESSIGSKKTSPSFSFKHTISSLSESPSVAASALRNFVHVSTSV